MEWFGYVSEAFFSLESPRSLSSLRALGVASGLGPAVWNANGVVEEAEKKGILHFFPLAMVSGIPLGFVYL